MAFLPFSTGVNCPYRRLSARRAVADALRVYLKDNLTYIADKMNSRSLNSTGRSRNPLIWPGLISSVEY